MTQPDGTTAGSWLESVPALAEIGVRAFTTTRAAGSFSTVGYEPVGAVMARWRRLEDELSAWAPRLATATQVHGARILVHAGGWTGWLRGPEADGHFAAEAGTAVAISVADCVPVFLAHPAGAVALLHSGWRGTSARIVERGIALFSAHGLSVGDLVLHAGPAICGNCYEVSADVYAQLTGGAVTGHRRVDLRGIIAQHARAAGVRHIGVSELCTLCNSDRFFSHRGGDGGRQIAAMVIER